jgi:hypothetical protein
MTANVVIHFTTSRSPDQACNSQVVHSQIGGRLMYIDTPRRAGEPFVAGAIPFSPKRLEDVFATAMASAQGGLIEVMPPHTAAVIDFMKDRPGTIESIKAVLVSVTRDEPAQRQTTTMIDELVAARMDGEQLRVIFSGPCPEGSMEAGFAHVLGRLRNGQFPHCTHEAVFRGSRALGNARECQLPVALVLNHMVDFEAELGLARNRGEEESVLHQLALKVLAQRSLLATQAEINVFLDKLKLSPAVSKEWLDDMQRVWLLSKPTLPVIAQSGNAGRSPPEEGEEELTTIAG